jgi:hypothetical protein
MTGLLLAAGRAWPIAALAFALLLNVAWVGLLTYEIVRLLYSWGPAAASAAW